MPWFYLILAGFFECAFTTCLKLSDGLTRLGWSIAFVVLSIVSFAFLTLAAQKGDKQHTVDDYKQGRVRNGRA